MEKAFIGKNNKPYLISELETGNILKNPELLSMYSMAELDELYKKYFGNYKYTYKYILIEKIKLYDKSENINSFIFNNEQRWLDKNTRLGLMHLANCSEEDVPVVINEQTVVFHNSELKTFLTKLEIYASKCFLKTQEHISNVKQLKTLEEIINYDYTAGYPEKITLE